MLNQLVVFLRLGDPYRRVDGNKVSANIDFLSAIEESQYMIAQANSELDAKGNFKEDLISARYHNEFTMTQPDRVQYMDVAPGQISGISFSN